MITLTSSPLGWPAVGMAKGGRQKQQSEQSASPAAGGGGGGGFGMLKLELDRSTGVVSIEFGDKEAMAQVLGRISAYSEGKGEKGVRNESGAIQSRGYSGHNFPMATLLDFMHVNKDCLTQPETHLIATLRKLGMLADGSSSSSKKGGGASRKESGGGKGGRYLIAYLKNDYHTKMHELQHARYYLDDAFRGAVARAWEGLPVKQRSYLTGFLSRLGYHESVHLDEFQAYHLTEPANFWGMTINADLLDLLPPQAALPS